MFCTSQQALHKEMECIREPDRACNFPPWALNTLQYKLNSKHNTHNGQTSSGNQPNNNSNNGSNSKNISIVVPYIHRLGERFKMTCNNLGIQVHFKGSNTIKTLLIAPDARDNKLKKWGHIPVQMPIHQLPRGIHRRIGQIIWGWAQGILKGPISNTLS